MNKLFYIFSTFCVLALSLIRVMGLMFDSPQTVDFLIFSLVDLVEFLMLNWAANFIIALININNQVVGVVYIVLTGVVYIVLTGIFGLFVFDLIINFLTRLVSDLINYLYSVAAYVEKLIDDLAASALVFQLSVLMGIIMIMWFIVVNPLNIPEQTLFDIVALFILVLTHTFVD